MTIKGITPSQFHSLVEEVSSSLYQDNLKVKNCSPLSSNRIRATVTVKSSKGRGARLSYPNSQGKQHHLAAACWHAYRDVLSRLFQFNPEASVRTAHAIYKGREDFLLKFEATGKHNIGSEMFPLYYREACSCEEV